MTSRFLRPIFAGMKSLHHIVLGKRGGIVTLPDIGAKLCLNPVERTLYRLFMSHPEGISADNLLAHWQELCTIYARESRSDDESIRLNSMESLCAESKRVFYANISRIKRKFVDTLGARKAAPYIIKRDRNGLYRTRATLA